MNRSKERQGEPSDCGSGLTPSTGERGGQREKQTPCREPDAGLDPETLGSHPGPKAGSQLLSHPGIPSQC